ncbi:Cytochrome b5-like Heme/Steroid binding domain containing protein, putative [Leishmania lindenbergi]|uniref:Cytochrome b5-like Heme/Steroid binding domain containing protein n=1 Tax=Leishmania lindenbergi TaxID=651832 RepID=A0AAW2ZRP0_9TRYP
MKEYTREEVATHCTLEDCWVIVDGHVYHLDVEFITTLHPGGQIVLESAGKDGSVMFHDHHSLERVKPILEEYLIGKLREYHY